jgi:hypothetical protein
VLLTGCLDHRNFKETRIKLYNTRTLPALLNFSQKWTIKTRETRRIIAAEMQYM